jgi:hypothetical protein
MADDLGSLPSHPNSMLLQHDPDDGLPGYGGGSPTRSRRRAGDAMNRWLCACACWMPSPRACSPMWSPQVFCRFPARPAAATPPGRGCVCGGGGGDPKTGIRPPRRSLCASINERRWTETSGSSCASQDKTARKIYMDLLVPTARVLPRDHGHAGPRCPRVNGVCVRGG